MEEVAQHLNFFTKSRRNNFFVLIGNRYIYEISLGLTMIFKIIFGFYILCMLQFSKNFVTSLAENDIAEANNTRKAKICKSNSVFHNIISTN